MIDYHAVNDQVIIVFGNLMINPSQPAGFPNPKLWQHFGDHLLSIRYLGVASRLVHGFVMEMLGER